MSEDHSRGDTPVASRGENDARHAGERSPATAPPPHTDKSAGKSIGALYRRMSGWYILFSIAVFLFILFVGFQLARPLLPHLFGSGG